MCRLYFRSRAGLEKNIGVIPAKAGIQQKQMEKQPAVYILASRRNGTIYTGVTSNLIRRVLEHKNNVIHGFTQKYAVHVLVWFEIHSTMQSAIVRGKRIKNWKRKWKLALIGEKNPNWLDLYDSVAGLVSGSSPE